MLPRAGLGVLERVEDGRPVVPRKVRRRFDDVVAEQRRDGDDVHGLESELTRERLNLVDDPLERQLRPVDRVHLVDRDHDRTHPQ